MPLANLHGHIELSLGGSSWVEAIVRRATGRAGLADDHRSQLQRCRTAGAGENSGERQPIPRRCIMSAASVGNRMQVNGAQSLPGKKWRTIAVVSDIHANLPALEAVLALADERGAREIWNLGDHVGYNAFPNETIDLLRIREALGVIGDYDERVLAVHDNLPSWRRERHPTKLNAMLWAYAQLSDENKQYLRQLPRKQLVKRRGLRLFLGHGSPAGNDDGLSPATTRKRLKKLAKMTKADVILGGDSHRAFQRQVGDTTFINPGSVGRPDDGDPRAAFALMHLKSGETKVELLRVAYDVQRAVAEIRHRGQPEAFAQMMLQGRAFQNLENAV